MTTLLDEWKITLTVRTNHGDTPDKWDFTVLLDLNTGLGEQAWVEDAGIIVTGTEEDLDLRQNLQDGE
jgi:hypothetical protein